MSVKIDNIFKIRLKKELILSSFLVRGLFKTEFFEVWKGFTPVTEISPVFL